VANPTLPSKNPTIQKVLSKYRPVNPENAEDFGLHRFFGLNPVPMSASPSVLSAHGALSPCVEVDFFANTIEISWHDGTLCTRFEYL
jgi:hypothetical protein